MPREKRDVTMRVRIGDSEIEVIGPSDFVEKKIAEFLEKSKQTPVSKPMGIKENIARETGEVEQAHKKKLSVAQFFRKISSKNYVDRILAAGYFLEKFNNQDNFTAADISAAIRDAKISPPRNTNDAINGNIKKGFMMSSGDKDGKMAFVLTTDGEDKMAELFKE
jgi:hypothetical protein